MVQTSAASLVASLRSWWVQFCRQRLAVSGKWYCNYQCYIQTAKITSWYNYYWTHKTAITSCTALESANIETSELPNLDPRPSTIASGYKQFLCSGCGELCYQVISPFWHLNPLLNLRYLWDFPGFASELQADLIKPHNPKQLKIGLQHKHRRKQLEKKV